MLPPEVVLRSDGGLARARQTGEPRGPRTVASQALAFGRVVPMDVLSDPERLGRLDLSFPEA